MIGPFTPGFVGDANLATELAEIGVILLMFGVGRVGSRIGRQLDQKKIKYTVVEEREEIIERLLEQNTTTTIGNAASIDAPRSAAVERADLIHITVPDGFEAGRVTEIARQLSPGISILARSHSDAEAEHLAGRGADVIISSEEEIAQAMIEATLQGRQREPKTA